VRVRPNLRAVPELLGHAHVTAAKRHLHMETEQQV
jgi:site-specific recombinase XerC